MVYKPSTSEQETIQMVMSRVYPIHMRTERTWQEEAWLKTMAFFSGKQDFYIDNGHMWDATPGEDDDHDVIYRANKMASAIYRAVAKVSSVHAEFRAVPETGAARHRRIAETSERVFVHLREQFDFDEKQLLALMWASICGTSYYKVEWDPRIGDVKRYYMDADKQPVPDLMLTNEQRNRMDAAGQFDDEYLGDISCTVESPFAIGHDWSVRDGGVKACKFMYDKHYMDIDVIADAFDVDASDIMADDGNSGLRNYEEAIAFMSSGSYVTPLSYAVPKDKQGKRTSLIQMYERPSRKHKKGRWVVYAGGLLIRDKDNPYIGDRSGLAVLPYVKMDWVRHPGRWWGRSLAEDLVNPQFQLNNARSKEIAFLNVFGAPPTWVDPAAGIDTDIITTRAGSILKAHNPNMNVKVGSSPHLPPEVFATGDRVERDLNDIASQSEIDGSKLPGQMRSGVALRTMQSARSIALTIPQWGAVRSARDVGRIGLALGQMFYTDKRVMRYLGEDSAWVVSEFSGADLTNDLRVIGEPSSLETRDSHLADMFEALEMGALNPNENENDRFLVLKALKFRTDDEVFQDRLASEGVQEREIDVMRQDPARYMERPYPAMEYEDQAGHMRVLRRFMNTREFADMDPATKAVITAHWSLHKMFLQKEQSQQMAMAEASRGTPGQRGRASQPKR
jgi:hypothetical protein